MGLNLADVKLEERQLRVIGKGSRERVLPIGRMAVEWLHKWLKVRPLLAGDEGEALFVSKRRQRLSARSVQERLDGWGNKQALNAHVHPHKLRHSFERCTLKWRASTCWIHAPCGLISNASTLNCL